MPEEYDELYPDEGSDKLAAGATGLSAVLKEPKKEETKPKTVAKPKKKKSLKIEEDDLDFIIMTLQNIEGMCSAGRHVSDINTQALVALKTLKKYKE